MRGFSIFVGLSALIIAAPAFASDNCDPPLHPSFIVYDVTGESVAKSGGLPDAITTCGACHDPVFIEGHNSHMSAQADCFSCHVDNIENWQPGAFDAAGHLCPDMNNVKPAGNKACATCHGLVPSRGVPVEVPDDFENPPFLYGGDQRYNLTYSTGTIFSGNNISASRLNLADKENLNFPWDVHAQRLVNCTDCHHAANNPVKSQLKVTNLPFLKRDPRKPSISQYLLRPDHQLTRDDCESCHKPSAVHDFLPQRKRHFEVLECQACHVPRAYGPALAWEDNTVVTPDGTPLRKFRGFDDDGGSINVRFGHGYTPSLIPFIDDDGEARVGPFNMALNWFWMDEESGKPVPFKTVHAAYFSNDKYASEVMAALDADKNNVLSTEELYLETPKQVAVITARLKTLGVGDPVIRAHVNAYPLIHGVTTGSDVVRDCESCHAADSRLTGDVLLTDRLPGKVLPTPNKAMTQLRGGSLERDDGVLRWRRDSDLNNLYVFGLTRVDWSDLAGPMLLLMVILVLAAHGGYRFYTRGNRRAHSSPVRRVYMYRAYERIWHWLMAGGIIVLMITGFEIHYPATIHLLGFRAAVAVHNVVAAVLVLNAFLSLFYHLASNDIRQFIPKRQGFIQSMLKQMWYYSRGIFIGSPHPTEKNLENKLNPLQQVTYLGLLNVLLPLQVITGILIWVSSRRPELFEAVGGLSFVAPIHNLGSWLFLTFLVMHVYLTTTGHTLTSNIRAMIDGYDEIEAQDKSTHAQGENNVQDI